MQRELREIAGVTAIVYDQTCAAEKRRRRKRGRFPDPAEARLHQRAGLRRLRRLLGASRTACRSCRSRPSSAASARSTSRAATRITPASKASARASSPSQGGALKQARSAAISARTSCRRCPSRLCLRSTEPYGILVTGVGGTGVVTIGALLGMAAHLEGKGCHRARHDRPRAEGRRGLSAMSASPSTPEEIHAVRIAAGGARLLLGCDLVVSASADALSKLQPGVQPRDRQQPRDDHRRLHPQPRSAVSRAGDLQRSIADAAGAERRRVSSTRPGSRPGCWATRSRPTCSCSAMPVSAGWCRCRPSAIERAIELNGVAVEFNQQRLPLGPPRRARSGAGRARARRRRARVPESHRLSETLDELIERRVDVPDRLPGRRLCARAMPTLVARVREAEAAQLPGGDRL